MNATLETIGIEEASFTIAERPLLNTLPSAVISVARHWSIGEDDTLVLLQSLLTDLATDLYATSVTAISEVTGDVLTLWCYAAERKGRVAPYERRAAVFIARSALETLATVRLGPDDLTIGLGKLSTTHKRRPLLPLEHAAVRAAAHRTRCDAHSGSDNRIRRMAVALAEAGGTTNEVPQVTPADIRRGNGTVTFTGTRDTARRNVALTPWGRTQILGVLDELDFERPLAYRGHQGGPGGSPAASISGVAKRILSDAGLVDGDVTLESLRNTGAVLAWNGRDIEPVLTVLGLTTKHGVQRAWNLVHWLDS